MNSTLTTSKHPVASDITITAVVLVHAPPLTHGAGESNTMRSCQPAVACTQNEKPHAEGKESTVPDSQWSSVTPIGVVRTSSVTSRIKIALIDS